MNATAQQIARKLVRYCTSDTGAIDSERVAGALAWTRQRTAAERRSILTEFLRLMRGEVGRRRAIIEHAGPITEAQKQTLQELFSREVGHPVSIVSRENPDLIAGMRVRIGDNVIDSSVAGRLDRLASAVR